MEASHYAEFPYPGERPAFSHIVTADGKVLELIPDDEALGGWRLAGTGASLGSWLQAHGAEPMETRVPVLS